MTLTNILADCYRRLGFETSPASAVSTRLTAFVNEAQRDILGRHGMERLRRLSFTFASVASQAEYALPPTVARILSIYEGTNDLCLMQRGASWYRAIQPDATAVTGTPEAYIPLGWTNASAQPSAAAQLLVDSTSAADTNTIYIEGIVTGGLPYSGSTTMTGTTAKNLGPATMIAVTRFYLSAAAVGTVTLVQTAEGGTILATIPIGFTQVKYPILALWPTPSTAITYSVDAERNFPDMVAGTDEPSLPDDFHWLLGVGARMMEYEKQDDGRYGAAKADFERGIQRLRAFLSSNPVAIVSANPRRSVASRLGAWYPAGT